MRRELEETRAELALVKLPYLLECKVIFFFMGLKYEVALNTHMKHQMGPRQTILLGTGPCEAKPKPA